MLQIESICLKINITYESASKTLPKIEEELQKGEWKVLECEANKKFEVERPRESYIVTRRKSKKKEDQRKKRKTKSKRG